MIKFIVRKAVTQGMHHWRGTTRAKWTTALSQSGQGKQIFPIKQMGIFHGDVNRNVARQLGNIVQKRRNKMFRDCWISMCSYNGENIFFTKWKILSSKTWIEFSPPVVYTGFRGWGGVPAGLGGGTFIHWRNEKFRIFSNSKIIKKCKKINENFIIFWKFTCKFCDFL